MAQKERTNRRDNRMDEMDVQVIDSNDGHKDECNEEMETTFTPIQKLEVRKKCVFY